ncbi:MAG: M20/M25/M40 family metallo-hydrolase [Bacillota bacterium]|nr:M20/M25/M40 family metallo-hydrolase [Bacillota bacterium]
MSGAGAVKSAEECVGAVECVGAGPAGEAGPPQKGSRRPTAEEFDLLHAMVAERSFSGSEGCLASLLRERLEAGGWRADIDATGNLIAELGAGQRTLLFLGHLDTAPGWLPVRVEDGALCGRGSVDAKGALAAFVAGAERAMRDQREREGADVSSPFPLRLVLIGAVGEEADSRGAKAILGSYRPDWCVVGEPSGWDGVTLGYKGCQTARVTVSCPGGHGGGPSLSAAEVAAEFWHVLSASLAAPEAGAGFSRLTCSLRGFSTASDGLTDSAELTLDWRLPAGLPSGEPERLMAEAAGPHTTARTRISWRAGALVPGFVAGKNNVLVRSFLAAIRTGAGQPRFKLKSGTSDMNLAGPAWGCPILAYGPGDSALDHTPEERLDLGEYAAGIEVWRTVLGEASEIRRPKALGCHQSIEGRS